MTLNAGRPGSQRLEQRAHRRFPIQLGLRFVRPGEKNMPPTGDGGSINISSTGLLFRCSGASSGRLHAGDILVTALDWPVSSGGSRLVLLLSGHVVWKAGSNVGMSVSHYELLSEPEVGDLGALAVPGESSLATRLRRIPASRRRVP